MFQLPPVAEAEVALGDRPGSTRTDYSCMMASTRSVTVDTDAIMRNILVIRGQRVLLDSDLAEDADVSPVRSNKIAATLLPSVPRAMSAPDDSCRWEYADPGLADV